jgi:hypothetical protein
MWQQANVITHFFCSKTYLWMRKSNIVIIIFNFHFEGEMRCLVIVCAHEREYA